MAQVERISSVLHPNFPSVVCDTGAERCLERIPTRSMHQEMSWSMCGSRGLLETWRHHVLSTSLTIIVPREPQRAVVYILSLGASSRARVSLSRTLWLSENNYQRSYKPAWRSVLPFFFFFFFFFMVTHFYPHDILFC